MSENNNFIDPRIWGRPTWDANYYIVLAYPDKPSLQDKEDMKTYFMSLGKVIPCGSCRENYKQHLLELPIEPNLVSREKLVKWLISMENAVRKTQGRRDLTYEEVIDRYVKKENSSLSSLAIPTIILGGLLIFSKLS
jgi:hypothetical protein